MSMPSQRACLTVFVFSVLAIGSGCSRSNSRPLVVGSKAFTESIILGWLVERLADQTGVPTEYRQELGGTQVVFDALIKGSVDIYPEYTGTLIRSVLSGEHLSGTAELRDALRARHLLMSRPLGFNNTYSIAVPARLAEVRGLRAISDLREHADLRVGLTSEFLGRDDGWPALRTRYELPQRDVRGMAHEVSYQGIVNGSIDVIDAYSTDAELLEYGLVTLRDDREFFPRYDAVIIYREDLRERYPLAVAAILQLEERLTEAKMRALNSRVSIDDESASRVAADYLEAELGGDFEAVDHSLVERLFTRTVEHCLLVALSMVLALVVALPLGIAASRHARTGQAVLAVAGVLQTVPSLALLALLIPLLAAAARILSLPPTMSIGTVPAVIALFLYSLLPIIRNTHAGLLDISREIRESAAALGLPRRTVLLQIELPLAARTILAGIKTAVIINIGTATLGALIGAGGYGQPILTGIRLSRTDLILEGALPAALLALVAHGAFEIAERRLIPRGLRSVRNDA